MMRPTYSGGFFNLLQPFALLAGVVSLSMLVLHGCTYAALKAGEPMAARAVKFARAAAAVYVIAFIATGAWVATSLPGITSPAAPIRSVPPIRCSSRSRSHRAPGFGIIGSMPCCGWRRSVPSWVRRWRRCCSVSAGRASLSWQVR